MLLPSHTTSRPNLPFGLPTLGMKLETYLHACLRRPAAGMQVGIAEVHDQSGLHQPPCLGVEHVLVPADLVVLVPTVRGGRSPSARTRLTHPGPRA